MYNKNQTVRTVQKRIFMDQKEILTQLAELANELDDRDMTREADAVAEVMQRVAQDQGWFNWNNIGRDVSNFASGVNEFSKNYNPADPRFMPNKVQQVGRGIGNAFQSAVDEAVEKRMKQMNQQSPGQQATRANQPAAAQQESGDLLKRYLGWGFDAATRKGVEQARAALQQHLQANKQSPAFTQQVMQAFESQIANQKAFQNQKKNWA